MFDSTIAGIPCQIEEVSFLSVPPWSGPAHTCPSSDDFYGYIEIEFDVYDRKGYRAEWLERKMGDEDIERIEQEIISYHERGM